MVDFKIKGTKLPVISKRTEFRCIHWRKEINNNQTIESLKNNYISFGSSYYNDEIYILAEGFSYEDTLYYMFKESDIIKLAKEQGMIEEELIKGNWYEGETPYDRWLFKFDKLEDNKYYTLKTCTPIDNYKNRTRGHFLELKNIKPANMEEVYKFFPDEKQEEFKLPEKWCVKDCEEVSLWATKVFGCGVGVGDNYLCVNQTYFPSKVSYGFNQFTNNYTEITFEQFKKYVLKENNNMENKEIIGYKLIKPEYENAAVKIVDYIIYDNQSFCYYLANTAHKQSTLDRMVNQLTKAGVLDLWFEPVYKTKEKVVSVGGKFDVVIKDNKIWHKSDDITHFVEQMFKTFGGNSLGLLMFGRYEAVVSNVIFEKTGCQNVETKLSDWKQVYETYKNMQ